MSDATLKSRSNLTAHLVAFVVVAIWGSTFVFTKLLLQHGLSPAHIFTLRFLIAYLLMIATELAVRPRHLLGHLLSATWRDELMMAVLGVTGGSLYFLA